MILISITITVAYLLLIGSFAYGFDKVTRFHLDDISEKTKFSIIVPFRNEAENLTDLIQSIEKLNYPKHLFEVVFVDDDSEDGSLNLIKKYFETISVKNKNGFDFAQPDISTISNERKTNSPKKDAITSAINQAKYEWIITTDADCILPKYWLDSFDQFVQKSHTKCIVAPVTYCATSNFLNR